MTMQSLSFTDYSSNEIAAATVARYWFEWNNLRVFARNLWGEVDSYIHATDTNSFIGGTNFDHSTHIPVVSEIHEDLMAIMYSTVLPHEDWLGWRGHTLDPELKTTRKKLLTYIQHVNRENGFRVTMRQIIDDFCRYGNAFAQTIYKNEIHMNPDGDVEAGFTGPAIKRISPYDIVFNPTASEFCKTPKIIRSMMSVGEFLQWTQQMEDNGYEVNQEAKQSVLDRRSSGSQTADTSNVQKNQQYVPDGFGTIEQYYMSGFVEVLWFYGSVYDERGQEVHNDRLIVVTDRKNVLLDKEERNARIYKAGWKNRPDNLWSQGPLDNIVGINYMINHRENAKNDAIDKFIYPDRAYVGEVDEIYDEVTQHTKYIMPEGGSVTDIIPDSTVLTYDNQIAMHLEMARRAARLPQQLAGFRSPGEKTATEVQNLNDGAFRGFINKAEQFEQEFLEPVITSFIDIARENFNSVITVLGDDEEGITRVLEITEDDLKAKGVLIPYGARRFARQLQQLAGMQSLFSTGAIQVVAPHINLYNLTKAWEELNGFDDFDLVQKFAAIEESVESQQFQAEAERELVNSLQQPTIQELELADQDTSVPQSPQSGNF